MKTDHELKVEALEKRLKPLLGKSVFFKKQIIVIKSYRIFTNAVAIITDDIPVSLELHLAEKWIDELSGEIPVNFTPIDTSKLIEDEKPVKHQFKEITPEQLKRNDQMENTKPAAKSEEKETQVAETTVPATTMNIVVAGYNPTEENIQVKNALMDMLKKVSTSSHAIAQAKAVCDIANTMVNIQKNEIQLIQMVNKIK